MFLIDSNVWLEGLLEQQRHNEVAALIKRVPVTRLRVTDFALHSICLICAQRGRNAALNDFLADVILPGDLRILSHPPTRLPRVLEVSEQHQLDFDDAYQYLAAERHNLEIVSFDAHFDRTPRGRMTPARALEMLEPRPH